MRLLGSLKTDGAQPFLRPVVLSNTRRNSLVFNRPYPDPLKKGSEYSISLATIHIFEECVVFFYAAFMDILEKGYLIIQSPHLRTATFSLSGVATRVSKNDFTVFACS